MARKKVLFVHAAYASNMSLHRRRASSIMRYRSPASARLLTSASSSGVTSDGSRAGAVDDSPRNQPMLARARGGDAGHDPPLPPRPRGPSNPVVP